jgi:hypothetical protein
MEQKQLPGYSGNPGEVILVMNKNEFSQVEDSINQYLAYYHEFLPQAERIVKLVPIHTSDFGKIFQIHRNIIVVEINSNLSSKVEVTRNRWSNGQIVITIMAKNIEELLNLLPQYSASIIETIKTEERQRLILRNRKFGEEKYIENHQLRLTLQKDIYTAKDTANLLWLRIERERPLGGYQHQISQGIIVYQQTYSDTSQLLPEKILAYQDSITKKHIPGPTKDAYFSISYKMIQPEVSTINFNGKYAKRVDGLWRMENNHMGGPFTQITVVDIENGRLITVLGYVFAPQFPKLDYLNEVEAIVYSLTTTKK